MKLRITHTTRYDYTPTVEHAQHMAHLKPRDTPAQRLLSHHLHISPAPASLREGTDVHGNHRVYFTLDGGHDSLAVTATSEVHTLDDVAAPGAGLPWEQVRERLRYRAAAPHEPAAEFAYPSPYVPRHDDFAAYARLSFAPGRGLLEAARELNNRIHAEFTYETGSTEVNTPAHEALLHKRGVCQDFAHVLVACLRALGLGARYVSGYLLTQPPPGQPRLIGADASHAWASVYLPGPAPEGAPADAPQRAGTWYDLCPTNQRHGAWSPGPDYVTVAVGRDYADVSPLRGVIQGGARHKLHVGVTVEPAPAPTPEETT